MRQYLCECAACGWQKNVNYEEPFPQLGDMFLRYCSCRQEETTFETGDAFWSHVQFRGRKMSNLDVIDYIAKHEEWRQEHTTMEVKR